MVKRGARTLIFLSRSGLSNTEARKTVSGLQERGIKVTVIQVDVTNTRDVQMAVDAASGPIKGVVQAPLSLHVRSHRLQTFLVT